MRSRDFNDDLDLLEAGVAIYFNELLAQKKEIVIFEEADLENDIPEDYLEVRNHTKGSVFDIHPLKVSYDGILVIEADGSYVRHLIEFQDLSSLQDRINLLELMENNL